MRLTSPEAQRKHISEGEQDVKDWKEWEAFAGADVKKAEDALRRNPSDPVLQKQHRAAIEKHGNVQVARQQREMSVEAAKRCFGWVG